MFKKKSQKIHCTVHFVDITFCFVFENWLSNIKEGSLSNIKWWWTWSASKKKKICGGPRALVFTIYYERWRNLPPLGDDRNMRQDNYYPVFVWDEVIYWRAWVINGIIDLPGAFVCPYDAVGWTLKINCCSYHHHSTKVLIKLQIPYFC